MVISVLCDKRIPIWLKSKMYRSIMRPTMLYGSECWVIDRKIEQSMSVVEMKMFRLTNGVTKDDRIRNEYVRGGNGVALIVDKMR
jgi:alpha-D-ribose 1-methylphosphonate 5-triphosphate synthase subunit PhnH